MILGVFVRRRSVRASQTPCRTDDVLANGELGCYLSYPYVAVIMPRFELSTLGPNNE